jgi:hypothetical protein
MRQRQSGCPRLADIDAFGVDWNILDPLLHLFVAEKRSLEEIAQTYGLDNIWLKNLQNRIKMQPQRTRTRYLNLGNTEI